MRNLTTLGVGIVLSAFAVNSYGQISVNINGKPVTFTDSAPKKIAGRVMVPLRPVLEAMQISIEFDPATRSVTATEGDKRVIVTLGSKEAYSNGKLMLLDVPAQDIGGRTYIPLRFFGEALGAKIDWSETLQKVEITGRFGVDSGSDTEPVPGLVPVITMDSAPKLWYVAGDKIQLSLQAGQGFTATAYFDGGKIPLPMRETSPGKYQVEYTIPASSTSKQSFADANPFAVVSGNGKQTVVALNRPISVDNTSPTISGVEPIAEAKMMEGRPVIGASLDDGVGSGIDISRLVMTFDNVNVTDQSSVTKKFISYRPAQNLTPGKHTFKIVAVDLAGNRKETVGSFSVTDAKNLVLAAQLSTNKVLEPGDEIKLTGKVSNEVTAVSVRLGKSESLESAKLANDGTISYSHTVSRNESFDESIVSLVLTTKNGTQSEYVLNQTISTVQAKVTAPTLGTKSKVDNATGKIILEGSAPKASKVRITVQPVSILLGVLKNYGSVSEFEVDVKADGTFSINDIPLTKMLGKSADEYIVKMKSVTEKGRESEETVTTLKG